MSNLAATQQKETPGPPGPLPTGVLQLELPVAGSASRMGQGIENWLRVVSMVRQKSTEPARIGAWLSSAEGLATEGSPASRNRSWPVLRGRWVIALVVVQWVVVWLLWPGR